MQEVKPVGADAAAKMPWLSKALQEGTFQLVYDGLQKSVQVRMSHATFNAGIPQVQSILTILRCIAGFCCHLALSLIHHRLVCNDILSLMAVGLDLPSLGPS